MSYTHFAAHYVNRKALLDVDRKLNPRITEKLASRVAQTPEEVFALSLREYIPVLCPKEEMESSRPPWVLRYGPHFEDHAGKSAYPETQHSPRTFYYPYCPECFTEARKAAIETGENESYIRKIWRLAFVTVCPACETPLLDYDHSSERADSSESLPPGETQTLLRFQQKLLRSLTETGKAPEGIRSPEGRRLDASELFSVLHLVKQAMLATKRGRFLRLHLASECEADPDLLESVWRVESARLPERRQVMLALASLLRDWPERLREALGASGFSLGRLYGREREPTPRASWLEGYAPEVDGSNVPAPPEPIEAGGRTDHLHKLSLEEVLELQPAARKQFELLGVTEEDLRAATLSDAEWDSISGVFEGYGDYARLLHNRAVLALMRLMEKKGLEPGDLPEAFYRPLKRATDTAKTKLAELLEEAFGRLSDEVR
jgi:hypothetical protein